MFTYDNKHDQLRPRSSTYWNMVARIAYSWVRGHESLATIARPRYLPVQCSGVACMAKINISYMPGCLAGLTIFMYFSLTNRLMDSIWRPQRSKWDNKVSYFHYIDKKLYTRNMNTLHNKIFFPIKKAHWDVQYLWCSKFMLYLYLM
jgi:hypothetical protein